MSCRSHRPTQVYTDHGGASFLQSDQAIAHQPQASTALKIAAAATTRTKISTGTTIQP